MERGKRAPRVVRVTPCHAQPVCPLPVDALGYVQDLSAVGGESMIDTGGLVGFLATVAFILVVLWAEATRDD